LTPDSGPAIDKDWAHLVSRIERGDSRAEGELFDIFQKGIRFFISRSLRGSDVDDHVHDCFIMVLKAIRNQRIREPARLMGFVRVVVKRHLFAQIETMMQNRQRNRVPDDGMDIRILVSLDMTPDRAVIDAEQARLMRAELEKLPHRGREILSRFYLLEQPRVQICNDLKITETQFRLSKNRAKNSLIKAMQHMR
jgi:RNA polymerase sigma factor (sigma-70 family)